MRKIIIILTLIFGFYTKAQNKQIPEDGITTIIKLFDKKPLVALGETHGHKQLYQFLNKLVKQENFYSNVNIIAIEAGNALYQKTLDDYIFGKDITYDELQKVWINTTQSPVDPWNVDVYFNFLQTIRNLNKSLPQKQQIRILAADPAIEWSQIKTKTDYEKARGSRNSFYSKLVINEVLNKNKKALLICGGAHFGYTNSKKINQIIEKSHPKTTTVVLAVAGLGRVNKKYEQKLSDWKNGTITKLKNTWVGELPGPSRVFPGSKQKPKAKLKQDFADYLLYFGSSENLEYGKIDTKIYNSDSLWKELNRRSLIRFNNKLKPETRKTGILRPTAYN